VGLEEGYYSYLGGWWGGLVQIFVTPQRLCLVLQQQRSGRIEVFSLQASGSATRTSHLGPQHHTLVLLCAR